MRLLRFIKEDPAAATFIAIVVPLMVVWAAMCALFVAEVVQLVWGITNA